MAIRPVFEVAFNKNLYVKRDIEFQWYSGFALSQKRKCIQSLHQNYLERYKDKNVLEISSKSENKLGVQLSAFNLMMNFGGKTFSVETAYQGGKIFEHGGPFTDLLDKLSIVAKKDSRLKTNGKVLGFSFFEENFPCSPITYFYNWLYINAIAQNEYLSEEIMKYDAFTDIVFNPQKSLNCQAIAAAIYVSLCQQSLLKDALENSENFLNIVYPKL
jgi:type I restriction enzyme M protein